MKEKINSIREAQWLENIKRQPRIVLGVLLAAGISLLLLLIAAFQLREIREIREVGREAYDRLADLVKKEDVTTGAVDGDEKENTIDFETLQKINGDAVAWVEGAEGMDYPVIAASEYDKYLHQLPDGVENPYGTPFLDFHHPSDFSGRLNIIYGRRASGGEMFGALLKYREQSYYEKHPNLTLYTAENEDYQVELLYGFEVKAGEWRERAFMYEVNLASLLEYGAYNSTFQSDVEYGDEDRFLVLSAGGKQFDDKRYVVIGVLKPR